MNDVAKVGSFVDKVVGGGTPSRNLSSYWSGEIPWASVKDLKESSMVLADTEEHISAAGLTNSAANLIPAGTPIVCTRMAVGRCVMPEVDVAINQDLKALFPRPETDGRYLAHGLTYLQPRLDAVATGSTVKGISIGQLLSFELYKPGMPEQRKIAEILDTADEAIRSIERLTAKLEQARQGIFRDLLVLGRSTPPLAATRKPWPIVQLRDLYAERPRNGLYKPPRFHGSGAPMVQMGQLFRGLLLDASDAPRVQVTASELERFGLSYGDLLFGRRSLVLEGAGKCAVVDHISEPMTFESSLIRVRIDSSQLSPFLAALYLASPEAARDRMRYVRQVAVSGVTSDDIGNFMIPLPPMFEQQRIGEVVRAQQSQIEIAREESVKLRLMKQGLVDDLLTGRVRVGALAWLSDRSTCGLNCRC